MSSLGSPRQSELINESAEASQRQSKVIASENNSLSAPKLPPRKNSALTSDSYEENDEIDEREKKDLTLKKRIQKKTALAKQ